MCIHYTRAHPDTLRCGIELESLLLIDIGVGVAFGELHFLYQLPAAEI